MNLTRPPCSARRGLSLIEVVVALAIVSLAGLALAYSSSTSVAATRMAKPRLVAQQALQRTVEELRGASRPLATFYTTYWGSAALTDAGTAGAYLSLDTSQTYTDVLAPALAVGDMGKSSVGGAVLRVRFLSEASYNQLWGTSVDLDFNGATNDGIARDGSGSTAGPAYRMYPLVVEVHYRDEQGDQVLRLVTTIGDTPVLDPQRT